MDEFNNRVDAQRQILEVVNRRRSQKEELFGLSAKAMERWISANQIDPNSRLIELLTAASRKLFFLANKSQEQVTDEYRTASVEISALLGRIEEILA